MEHKFYYNVSQSTFTDFMSSKQTYYCMANTEDILYEQELVDIRTETGNDTPQAVSKYQDLLDLWNES